MLDSTGGWISLFRLQSSYRVGKTKDVKIVIHLGDELIEEYCVRKDGSEQRMQEDAAPKPSIEAAETAPYPLQTESLSRPHHYMESTVRRFKVLRRFPGSWRQSYLDESSPNSASLTANV